MRKKILLVLYLTFLVVYTVGIIYSIEIKPEIPLYIYSGKTYNESFYYTPKCWVGDYPSLKMNVNWIYRPKTNKYCMKFIYYLKKRTVFKWIAVYWTFPVFNWGNIDAGLDLSNAGKLTFWARSEKGTCTIAVQVGGNYGKFSDTASITSGIMRFSTRWKKFTISLKGHDLTHVGRGFSVIIRKQDFKSPKNYNIKDSTVIFYLDEIKFQ